MTRAESEEVWFDPDAPGRLYMRRVYESASVGLSLALFFYWVHWEDWCSRRQFELAWA